MPMLTPSMMLTPSATLREAVGVGIEKTRALPWSSDNEIGQTGEGNNGKSTAKAVTLENYKRDRERFLRKEQDRFIGSKLWLSSKEEEVNRQLMFYKEPEMLFPPKEGFPPSRYFTEAKKDIEASKVFEILRKMPKGGALHCHDIGIVSAEWLVSNLTYRPHLFVRGQNRSAAKPLEFRFLPNRHEDELRHADKDWIRFSVLRNNSGDIRRFDDWLSQQFTLKADAKTRYPTLDAIWKAFEERFGVMTSLITYRPVFADFWRQALQEYVEDNVQYVELRAFLPPLYEADGTEFGPEENVQVYADVTREFVRENKGRFFGARIIYAPHRLVAPSKIDEYAKILAKLKDRFGDFIAGFDLVGQEDVGKPLIEFASELLQMAPKTRFFFHAGETNIHGWTDDNMVDAVLLNTTRMGHGFALTNHPLVFEELKRKDIAVEVNPISNQVLLLVSDLRNHPAASLLADEVVPVVISNDDPSLWGAKGLSYDWYEAFMGMANIRTDLRMLKQLGYNSIRYSALSPEEKTALLTLYNTRWNDFIDGFIHVQK